MANLLYVTSEFLAKLRSHSAYRFWQPIVHNFPIRLAPLEERSFHPRNIDIENGYIYLSIDMKFIYCRDGMVSFLYEDQDLSFRFTVSQGILRTLDNKQFTAILGKIAKVSSSNDAKLLNADMVYHPYFDAGKVEETPEPEAAAASEKGATRDTSSMRVATVGLDKPKRRRGRPRKPTDNQTRKTAVQVPEAPAASDYPPRSALKKADHESLIFDLYSKTICDQIYNLRLSENKTFAALASRFGIDKREVKRICNHYDSIKRQRSAKKGKAASPSSTAIEWPKEISSKYPNDLCQKIVHMKNVSKKSYQYVAEKFAIPIDDVRMICARNLKRPRIQVQK